MTVREYLTENFSMDSPIRIRVTAYRYDDSDDETCRHGEFDFESILNIPIIFMDMEFVSIEPTKYIIGRGDTFTINGCDTTLNDGYMITALVDRKWEELVRCERVDPVSNNGFTFIDWRERNLMKMERSNPYQSETRTIEKYNLTINDLLFGVCQIDTYPCWVEFHPRKNQNVKMLKRGFSSLRDVPEIYRDIPIVRIETSRECSVAYVNEGDHVYYLLDGDHAFPKDKE